MGELSKGMQEVDLEVYQRANRFSKVYRLDGTLYSHRTNELDMLLVFFSRTRSEVVHSRTEDSPGFHPERSVFMTAFQAESLNRLYERLENDLQDEYKGFIRAIPMRVVKIQQGGYGVTFTLPEGEGDVLGRVIDGFFYKYDAGNFMPDTVPISVAAMKAKDFLTREADTFCQTIDRMFAGKFAFMPTYHDLFTPGGATYSNFFVPSQYLCGANDSQKTIYSHWKGAIQVDESDSYLWQEFYEKPIDIYCVWPIDVMGLLDKQLIPPTWRIQQASSLHRARVGVLNRAMREAGVRHKFNNEALQYSSDNQLLSLKLRFRGNPGVLDHPSVGFTGTRSPSQAATRLAEELSKAATKLGIVPFACFVVGVDMRAHKGAIASGGMTGAVVHDMADYPEPGEREEGIDYEKMLARIFELNGLVISPYLTKQSDSPEEKRKRYYQRDSLISALSDVLVVVEGRADSGTVDTAMNAIAQGKKVCVINWKRVFHSEGARPKTGATYQVLKVRDVIRSFGEGGFDPQVREFPSKRIEGAVEDWLPTVVQEIRTELLAGLREN